MNRTDRLLAIVLELQGRGWRRAEDLAATFETSKRTIYRDVLALGQAGVPIVSIPGRGYSLVEGYFLAPLSFTTSEATMLLFGSELMARSFDKAYRDAARSAGRKIAGVLPERLREEVAALREAIAFIPGESELAAPLTNTLNVLRGALLDRRVVRFRYHARSHADAVQGEEREVWPLGLAHVRGVWYLSAYDTARRGERTFHLARIDDLRALDATFERPEGFRLRRLDLDETANIVVRALFDASVARWVIESPSFYAVAHEPVEDGLLVTLRVRSEEDVVQWLLGWGRHARVLEPESLRLRMAEEARGIAALYANSASSSERCGAADILLSLAPSILAFERWPGATSDASIGSDR